MLLLMSGLFAATHLSTLPPSPSLIDIASHVWLLLVGSSKQSFVCYYTFNIAQVVLVVNP